MFLLSGKCEGTGELLRRMVVEKEKNGEERRLYSVSAGLMAVRRIEDTELEMLMEEEMDRLEE